MKTPLLYSAIVVFLMLVGNTHVMAQQKYEREVRIQATDVPADALNFVNSSPIDSKIKWYREINLNTTSIEAKTKYKRHRYSIEFSENGILEDIEVEIKVRDLNPEIIKKIRATIEKSHGNFKLEKIQLQYSGNKDLLKRVLDNKPIPDALTIKYEIVISSKESDTFKRFELLFNEALELESTTEIITKNNINIEY